MESGSLPVGVFELPGEPAIVINGVPDTSPSGTDLVLKDVTSNTQSLGSAGCGEWLEGREVRKLFGELYYSGTVTQFDKETGWYRVVYEDGDFEDLDWNELEQVLLPLDITIPLKALAQKIIRMNQKPIIKYEIDSTGSQRRKARTSESKGKKAEAHEQNALTQN